MLKKRQSSDSHDPLVLADNIMHTECFYRPNSDQGYIESPVAKPYFDSRSNRASSL